MPRTARQRRGQVTASLVAAYLRPLAPGATATPSAYSGNDVQNVPWDVEVKAPREEAWKHIGRSPAKAHEIKPADIDPKVCANCGHPIRTANFSPGAALRQAARRRKPDHVLPPMVVVRPDGVGDAGVGDFIVMRRFEDDRAVLEELFRLRATVASLTTTNHRLPDGSYPIASPGELAAAKRRLHAPEG